jgi:hypothetical protein
MPETPGTSPRTPKEPAGPNRPAGWFERKVKTLGEVLRRLPAVRQEVALESPR